MDKSVLISIRPKWCEMIANGKKTVELRKTIPKISVPFKCYIYCTSVKNMPLKEYVQMHMSTGGLIDDWDEKVIGEFYCKNIDTICPDNFVVREDAERVLCGSCLTISEVKDYMGWKSKPLWERKDIYGWHISDLKIYDTPIDLSDFETADYKHLPISRWTVDRPPQSWMYVVK